MKSKIELRAAMRALRKQMAGRRPDAAQCAATFIRDMPTGPIVAVYRAVGSELDPEPLAIALEQAGCLLCLPVALERDTVLVFRRWHPGDPLEADVAGCPAPLPLAETVIPDIIVTPLLAFDVEGGRLGQGGGYYDRTFAHLRGVVRIGLAYAAQQLEALPMDAHDQRLDGVLTEVGYIANRKVT